MLLRSFAPTALLSACLGPLVQATTVTVYTPVLEESAVRLPSATSGPQDTTSVLTLSAVNVLPGNITEYAGAEVLTRYIPAGSGTVSSLSASVTTINYTIQEGASFIGNSFSGSIGYQSLTGGEIAWTPITGAAGCSVTAPPSASATRYHCAQVQVFNGTSTQTIFYNATASPVYTLTESTPPPTASATTGLLFPSGIPTAHPTSGATQLKVPLKGLLGAMAICYGFSEL